MSKLKENHIDELIGTIGSWGPSVYGSSLHINESPVVSANEPIVFDCETDEQDNMVSIGLTQDGISIFYFTDLKLIKELLQNSKLIAHNAKGDLKWLKSWGVDIKPEQLYYDTMLASYVQNTTKASHSLKDLAKEYLGMEWPKYKEVVGVGRKKQTLDKLPTELVANYNGMDVLATYRLWQYFEKTLTDQQKHYLNTIEIPCSRVLMEMELKGVKLDIPYLEKLDKEFTWKLDKIQTAIYQIWLDQGFTEDLNINSNAQIASLLESFGATLPRTQKGNKRTDKATLKTLNLEVADLLLEYSKMNKLRSTYTDGLLKNQVNGRIHCNFNQLSRDEKGKSVGISTGRLSSSGPNLQNIPTNTEEGKKIRRAFIA